VNQFRKGGEADNGLCRHLPCRTRVVGNLPRHVPAAAAQPAVAARQSRIGHFVSYGSNITRLATNLGKPTLASLQPSHPHALTTSEVGSEVNRLAHYPAASAGVSPTPSRDPAIVTTRVLITPNLQKKTKKASTVF